MASFDAGSIEARLELDRSNFDAGIDAAKARAKELESQSFNANLGADSSKITAEVAKMIVFMTSDVAAWMTGSGLLVDGGAAKGNVTQ